MQRSTRIARTGLTVLILGIIACMACMGVFVMQPEEPHWVIIGVGALLLCLGVDLLCLRAAKRVFLRHYSRMGMSKRQRNDNDLIHVDQ